MRKIILTIEIENIDGWSVNWNDEKSVVDELNTLKVDAEYAIVEGLGIDYKEIKIEAELINKV